MCLSFLYSLFFLSSILLSSPSIHWLIFALLFPLFSSPSIYFTCISSFPVLPPSCFNTIFPVPSSFLPSALFPFIFSSLTPFSFPYCYFHIHFFLIFSLFLQSFISFTPTFLSRRIVFFPLISFAAALTQAFSYLPSVPSSSPLVWSCPPGILSLARRSLRRWCSSWRQGMCPKRTASWWWRLGTPAPRTCEMEGKRKYTCE